MKKLTIPDIELYMPMSALMTNETTREEARELIDKRIKVWKDKPKYITFPINHEFYIRVAIECDEYITEVSRISNEDKEVYGSWNYMQDVEKRGNYDLPTLKQIYGSIRMSYSNNIEASISKNGNVHIYSISEDRKYTLLTTVTKDQWFQFLDGNGIPEVEKYITRKRFLDTKIIESIAGADEHGYSETYFQILNVFEQLYEMGYWTYDGFKRDTTTQ